MRKQHRKQTRSQKSHRNQKAHRSSFFIKRLKYFPAIAITVLATFIWSQPHAPLVSNKNDVLAYATNVSINGLLSATNAERSANSVGSLTSNSKLNSAAQAKANDMVTRNYWSHQTPDGQQPWVFITNAGYQYTSAGENLAYGFMTSSATVTGWMNSPPHKANLLSTNFTEVGFGIANSPDYVSSGQQTVVVAMYGKPQGAAAANPAPSSPATQPVAKQQATKPATQPAAEVQDAAPVPEVKEEAKEEKPDEEPIAVAVADTTPTAGSTDVQRIQVLTGGSAMWSATFVILGVCAIGTLWLIHRGFRFRHWLRASEKFIGSHVYLDLTVLAVVYLGFVLLTTSGTIR